MDTLKKVRIHYLFYLKITCVIGFRDQKHNLSVLVLSFKNDALSFLSTNYKIENILSNNDVPPREIIAKITKFMLLTPLAFAAKILLRAVGFRVT